MSPLAPVCASPTPIGSPAGRRGAAALAGIAVATLLGACGTAPPRPAGGAAGAPVATAPAPAAGGWFSGWFGRSESPLATLRDNMASAMRGTPVEVDMPSDDLVRLSVPLQHSFMPGRSAVRPALGAVLDRLAGELRNLPNASITVAGPADERGSALLAQDRAAAARDWLVSRGVAATRFTRPERHAEAEVEIRVAAGRTTPGPAAPVSR